MNFYENLLCDEQRSIKSKSAKIAMQHEQHFLFETHRDLGGRLKVSFSS